MNLSKLFQITVLALLGTGPIAVGTLAQDAPEPQPQDSDTTSKPKPAGRGVPGISDPNSTVENEETPSNWQPDTSPPTGLQSPTLGSPELAHSYWIPGFIYGSTIQSRPPGQQAVSNGWYADNYVGGQLSLLAAGSRSQFGLNYSGGGYFTTDSLQQNGWFQELSAGYTVSLNHWQIQMFNYFSYIPESQFGFAGGTNLALAGISGTLGPTIPGLGSSVIPNQSIYSATGPRYSNATAVQATYSLSRRSSITLGGSYGLLHFTEAGNIDSNMVLGSAGYNYVLSELDAIGIVYRYAGFQFSGEPQAFGSHAVSFVYNRKVARRVALTVFGGPQITNFRIPVNDKTRNVGASAGASLKYAFERGSIDLSYFHGLTGGSGILTGATTDQANVSFSRQLGRVWSGDIRFGYARNSALATASGTPSQSFDDWFIGAGVHRPFGRNVQFSGSYSTLFESTAQPICTTTGTSCSSSYTQQLISISLQFHTRPFLLP
jgi:hypothetical protein